MKIELDEHEAQFVANSLFEFAETIEKMGRDNELEMARDIYKKLYKILNKNSKKRS